MFCETCQDTGACPCGATDCGPKRCPDCYCDSCSTAGCKIVGKMDNGKPICEDCADHYDNECRAAESYADSLRKESKGE